MAKAAASINQEEQIAILHRFWEAVKGDVDLLPEVATSDFTLIEPDYFDEPFTSLEQYKQHVAKGTQTGAEFGMRSAERIGASLLLFHYYTPAGGGDTQEWRSVVSFRDGKVCRWEGSPLD